MLSICHGEFACVLGYMVCIDDELFILIILLSTFFFIMQFSFEGIGPEPMGDKSVLDLSENFAKIDEAAAVLQKAAKESATAYNGKKLGLTEQEDDTRTRNTILKKRSFDLTKESPKIKPILCKTKSLSSHYVVNFDELINCVTDSLDETGSFLNNPHRNEETGLISIYESSLPSKGIPDPIRLRNPRSGKAFIYFFPKFLKAFLSLRLSYISEK